MYIPTWLIIFLGFIAITIFALKKKRKNAKLNGNTPDNRLGGKYIDKLIRKHFKKIYYTSNLKKIRQEMENLAEELKLGWRLFEFVDVIRHYPSYYKEEKPLYSPFESQAIPEYQISSKKCCESELIGFFSDHFKFEKEDELIEYNFTLMGRQYILIICPPQFSYNCYYPVIILQKRTDFPKTHLFIKLYYEEDITEDFHYYELEEFQYEEWLEFLLDKMFETKEEHKKHLEELDIIIKNNFEKSKST